MDRGKVAWEQDLEKWEGRFGRYLDKDGDGIPYRTVPGNKHPKSAWFARGTGHDEYAAYTEKGDDWERNMERLIKKYDTARQYLPESEIFEQDGATIGIIAYGSTHPAIEEARDKLEAEGTKTDYLRLRSYPFRDEVQSFVEKHDKVYVVEMNRDGQMHQLLSLAYPEMVSKLVSIKKHDGLPMNARWTAEAIQTEEN